MKINKILLALSKLEPSNYDEFISVYDGFIIDILEKAYSKSITLSDCPPVSQDVIYLNGEFVGYVGDYIEDVYDEDIKFSQLVSTEVIDLFSAISKFKVLIRTKHWLITNGYNEPIEDEIDNALTNMLNSYAEYIKGNS